MLTYILLGIFTILLIYFIYRFVKLLQTTRMDAIKERDKQNIDLISKLDSELESESATVSESGLESESDSQKVD